ncbi:DegT/DnrJ/EryC1/StrS family aminotransferase [Polynucleobacter sp. UB-Tiil-W10]|nr:DegT/DnrJ/EryC1/StrS family aminotransferase [Polynucleobacter sp. UB-Tiil-W10]
MILMNDFKLESHEIQKEMQLAVNRVIKSGWYVLGPEVESFEKEWAQTCKTKYSIGVGNGMDAIEIILHSMNVGPGDEVITTPMTAFATVLAILRAGATPVLADIESDTALLSMDSVRRCISPRTKAVVLVHLYGQMKELDLWKSFCNEHHIFLIEDCAQSHLATWNDLPGGNFGVAGAYSFYPTKNLGALGDGGIIVTSDERLSRTASSLRNYGQSVRYEHPLVGMNSRLDEMQAAILSVKLKWLEGYTARRREIAGQYLKNIQNQYVSNLSAPLDAHSHVYHLYVVTSRYRDALQAHLNGQSIQSLIHYPIPIHHQKPCLDMLRDPTGLSISEEHAAQCLSIPCHPHMSQGDVERVIIAVNSFSPHH